jgi:hypothetical protein
MPGPTSTRSASCWRALTGGVLFEASLIASRTVVLRFAALRQTASRPLARRQAARTKGQRSDVMPSSTG